MTGDPTQPKFTQNDSETSRLSPCFELVIVLDVRARSAYSGTFGAASAREPLKSIGKKDESLSAAVASEIERVPKW